MAGAALEGWKKLVHGFLHAIRDEEPCLAGVRACTRQRGCHDENSNGNDPVHAGDLPEWAITLSSRPPFNPGHVSTQTRLPECADMSPAAISPAAKACYAWRSVNPARPRPCACLPISLLHSVSACLRLRRSRTHARRIPSTRASA